MKRIIACAAAFALAFAQPYTATCAELTEITQNAESQSVFLAVDGEITVTNGKITLTYDSTQIKLEEIKFCGTLKDSLIDVNAGVPGKIVIGFADLSPVKITDSIAEVIFSGVSETGSVFDCITSMTVDELVTEDADGNDVKLPAETVKLAASDKKCLISCSDSVSDSEGNVTTYLQLENTLPFTNGTFTVNYDPSVLRFANGEACGILSNSIYEINEVTPGVLKFTFISENAINSSGPAVKLEFTGLQKGSTLITPVSDELSFITAGGEIFNRGTEAVKAQITVDIEEKYVQFAVNEGTEPNTALISISEGSEITNGVIIVKYDTEIFKFESADICKDFKDVIYEYNETEQGTVKIVFISNEEITADGNFIKFNFSAIKTGTCEVTAEADELMRIDTGSVIHSISGISGSNTIHSEAGEISNTTGMISFDEVEGLTNGSFTVTYDPSEFTFIDIGTNDENKTEFETVETEPGTVKINFRSEEPVSSESSGFKITFRENTENPPSLTFTVDDVTLMAGETRISGFKISFTESAETEGYAKYDIDGNGVVNTADLISLARMITGIESGTDAADINNDKKINSADLVQLVKLLKE